MYEERLMDRMNLVDSGMFLVLLAVLMLPLLLNRYQTELRSIPGPFLASVTDAWRFWTVWKHQMPQRSLQLHRRYGPLVMRSEVFRNAKLTLDRYALGHDMCRQVAQQPFN